MRKPYYKKSHQAWYCEIGRKQIRLGTEKEAAFQEYHRLMAGQQPVTSNSTVAGLLDQFLTWTREHRSESTFRWYLLRCQMFVRHIGKRLKIDDLRPTHVDRWLAKDFDGCSNTYKHGLCKAVGRAFNWARKKRLIQTNPLEGIECPPYEPRETYLTAEQWKAAVAMIDPGDPFLDLLWFLKETGCRPQEARIIEAHHWDRAGKRVILERDNSKGKKKRRVIRLNDRASAIVKRLALKWPEGALLRNTRGNPWTKARIIERFSAMEKKLGFEFFPYAVRHTFCTDALLRGVDPMSVAILLGHTDATMVMRVYGHLIQHNEFLAQKLEQATNERVAS